MHCRWYPSMPCSGSPGGWYPSIPCRFPGQHPGGKLRGLAGGSPGPHPRGKLRGLAWGGSPGPQQRCLQAHTKGVSRPTPGGASRPTPRGVSRPTPGWISRPTPNGVLQFYTQGGCIPACTEARQTPNPPPPPKATAAVGTHPTGMLFKYSVENSNMYSNIPKESRFSTNSAFHELWVK